MICFYVNSMRRLRIEQILILFYLFAQPSEVRSSYLSERTTEHMNIDKVKNNTFLSIQYNILSHEYDKSK